MNVVIMAGGGGTRLWPLSRSNNPKQFIDLGTGKTLLEHTYDRARAVAESVSIFVATTEEYRDRITELLPQVPAENFFFEPERRDTGPAFATVAAQLQQKNQGQEPTIFMWADHVFTAEETFIADLKKIEGLIKQNPDHVIIIGHTPTFAETGLGYLEVGEALPEDAAVYRVSSFKEKPDRKTAEQYLAAGSYFWNMAYISLKPDYLLQQLAEHTPELTEKLPSFIDAVASQDQAAIHAAYSELPRVAIDYALLEKTPRILAVTGDYGWSDVGTWSAVQEVFGTHGDHVPEGHHIHVDSKNNYIYNATNKTVSMLGMENTIAVITDDAILITTKDNASRVKEVVTQLEADGKKDLL